MRQILAPCIFALLSLPQTSFACSVIELSASEKAKEASTIVLAAPIEFSVKPEAASDPSYQGEVTETIRWKTLVSWKGRYRPGHEFKTVMTFRVSRTDSCMSWSAGRRAQETQILYLHGKEPFDYFYTSKLSEWDAFELLGKRR